VHGTNGRYWTGLSKRYFENCVDADPILTTGRCGRKPGLVYAVSPMFSKCLWKGDLEENSVVKLVDQSRESRYPITLIACATNVSPIKRT
jgi:hypothetical protein